MLPEECEKRAAMNFMMKEEVAVFLFRKAGEYDVAKKDRGGEVYG